MRRKVSVLLLFLMILACSKNRIARDYYVNGALKTEIQLDDEGIPNGFFKEYFESGKLKSKGTYIKGKISDTVYSYYERGRLKEKGISINGLKSGWWYFYSKNGKIKRKSEYKLIDNQSYKNQNILFREDGSIDLKPSSFFKLNIPDTIYLGKNVSNFEEYYSNYNAERSLITVIVKNRYSEDSIKKDSFSDGTLTPRFGMVGYKVGNQLVEGVILEEVLNETPIGLDSTRLRIRKHKKYFEKRVYVNDTIK